LTDARDDSKEYLILNQLGRFTAPCVAGALRSALLRTGEPKSVRHSCTIGTWFADRLGKSYFHFPLSRAKAQKERDAGGGTRTPDTRIMIPPGFGFVEPKSLEMAHEWRTNPTAASTRSAWWQQTELLRSEWGFKLMGTSRRSPMISALAVQSSFHRKEGVVGSSSTPGFSMGLRLCGARGVVPPVGDWVQDAFRDIERAARSAFSQPMPAFCSTVVMKRSYS
jgi:hypothetical protein